MSDKTQGNAPNSSREKPGDAETIGNVFLSRDIDWRDKLKTASDFIENESIRMLLAAVIRSRHDDKDLSFIRRQLNNKGELDELRGARAVSRILKSVDATWQDKLRVTAKYIDGPGPKIFLKRVASSELLADKLDFFRLLIERCVYAEDLVATRADARWLESPDFIRAYGAGEAVSTWASPVRWRVYTLLNAARQAARIKGDFVECGVDSGGTARSVIEYLGPDAFAARKFFLFDTYDGPKEEQMTEEELVSSPAKRRDWKPVLKQVTETFEPFAFTRIIPGMVPETLTEYDGEAVAYLHIDMNVSLPEVEALKFFWPKLTPGAVVVFDDYGFPSHSSQRSSLDKVCESFGVKIMMLPTGQGLTWK